MFFRILILRNVGISFIGCICSWFSIQVSLLSFFCQRCIYSTDVVYQQLELHAADICNSVQSTCDVHVA